MKPVVFFTVVVLALASGAIGFDVPEEPRALEGYDMDTEGALFLTPYIEAGDIAKARELSQVKPLAGSSPSYSGFLNVNKTVESHVFFWLFPAKTGSQDKKTIIWLHGGPGVSSLYALFNENGPYVINQKGDNSNYTIDDIREREYSWTNEFNVLYLDVPVGTGYSFTKYHQGYTDHLFTVTEQAVIAVSQIEKLFPELLANSVIIGGESFGSKYATLVGYYMTDCYVRSYYGINSEVYGLYLGSPGISLGQYQQHAETLFDKGLIDSKGREHFEHFEEKIQNLVKSYQYEEAAEYYGALIIEGINYPYPTLYQKYTGLKTHYDTATGTKNKDAIPEVCDSDEMRERVHAGAIRFKRDRTVFTDLLSEVFMPVDNFLEEMLKNDARTLLLSPENDPLNSYHYLEQLVNGLDWKGANDYDDVYSGKVTVGDEVTAYYKKSNGLARVLLRNAGQLAPADQPEYTLDIVKRFSEGYFDGEGPEPMDR
jgi:vitellogenic carboxypeptidase-like protein